MSAAGVSAFEKEHLWMYLQALGFEPGPAAVACGKIVSLTHFGPNMFDKLNRDAFQIVSYFLFQTLDQSLSKEVFKFCWPPFDQKRDAEFRKHCCEWLKKISAECGGSFPQVVGSLFISPGGPKFVHLMYHFARYVALKYIKTCSKNSSVHLADTFNVKPQDLHKCIARNHIARNKFFQILQRQDYVIRKYQEHARLMLKQIRDLRAECLELQNHIKQMEPCDNQGNLQEKVQKVRSWWALVNETLEVLEQEREVVSSVLSLSNQYSLDGTNVAINIPRLLLDKIEKQMCQLHIGNVYESGKLNFLTIIQLLNEVLKIMKSEHCEAHQAKPTIDLQYLEKETRFQKERVSELKHLRYKVKEDLVSIRHSILEKQGEWCKKWEEFLGVSPFSLIKSSTPAVDLLPPMSPLSFDPASEETYAKSILFKYPATLPDTPEQRNQENDCGRENDIQEPITELPKRLKGFRRQAVSEVDVETLLTTDILMRAVYKIFKNGDVPASFLLQPASLLDKNSVTLPEKDLKMRTPREKKKIITKKTSQCEVKDSPSDTANNTENSTVERSLPARKCDPFQKEQDHLVEEVARAVLSESPKLPEGKEVQLEVLIDSLVSNPFLARNQLPRTPENLISEIRSSWKKAIETEDDGSTDLIQMHSENRRVLPESLNDETEFVMASFLSETTVSDFSESHLPEEEVSDGLKCVSPKHMVTSHIGDTPTQNQSNVLNTRVQCRQDLDCGLLKHSELSKTSGIETFSPAVHDRIDVVDGSKEENVEKADRSQASSKGPSMPKTPLWNCFPVSSGISSVSFEDTDFGILHETLPEEVGRPSLNSSNNTEVSFELDPNSPVMHSDIFPDGTVGGIQTTPKPDFRFQAICRRYEALKMSLSKKKAESCISCPETFERHIGELSFTPNKLQTHEIFNDLDIHDLHSDWTTPSLQKSHGGQKRSLSPLIKFSPEEHRLRTTVPHDLRECLPNLKEEETRSRSLDAEESPFNLKS